MTVVGVDQFKRGKVGAGCVLVDVGRVAGDQHHGDGFVFQGDAAGDETLGEGAVEHVT